MASGVELTHRGRGASSGRKAGKGSGRNRKGQRGSKASQNHGTGDIGSKNRSGAVSITEKDAGFKPGEEFSPLHEPDPHVADGMEITPL